MRNRLTERDLTRIVRRVIREDQESPVSDIERMNQSDIMMKQYIDKFGQKYIKMHNFQNSDIITGEKNKTMDANEKRMYRNIYSNSGDRDVMGKIDNHMKDLGFPNAFHIPENISRDDFDKLKKDWERSLTKSSVQNERDLTRIVRRVIREEEEEDDDGGYYTFDFGGPKDSTALISDIVELIENSEDVNDFKMKIKKYTKNNQEDFNKLSDDKRDEIDRFINSVITRHDFETGEDNINY